MARLSDYPDDYLVNLVAQHGTIAAAAREIGVPRKTLSDKINALRMQGAELPDDAYVAAAFEVNGLGNANDSTTWRDSLRDAENRAFTNQQLLLTQPSARADLSAQSVVGVMLISDLHIGSNSTDYLAFLRHVDLLTRYPNLYAICQGDMTEHAVSQRMLDSVLSQVFPPTQQLKLFKSALSELSGKVLCAVGGNHEGRVERLAGFDIGEYLYDELVANGGTYMKDGGVITITVGEQTYTWRVVHGDSRFGSMYNPTHKATQLARMSFGWCDILSTGHTHEAAVMQQNVPGVDGAPPRPVVALQAGSYKTLLPESYPVRLGFSHQPTVDMPAVILVGSRKQVIPFKRVEDMIPVLEALSRGNG